MTARTICIDARMIEASGIGTYLQGLLSGLRQQTQPKISISLLGDSTLIPDGPWAVRQTTAAIYSIREQIEIPMAVRREKASLLHAPHYNMPWVGASQTVVTVHDLIHLKLPQYWPSPAARAYARFFLYHVVPKARAILTVSNNTKRDLIETLSIPENRITVTYPGVFQERFRNPDPVLSATFSRLGLPPDYLLYIGNLKEFKNVERLVESYARLRAAKKDIPALVLVGRNFISGFDNKINQTPGIRWLGEIQRDLLPWLYKNALAFLFPSLYEGFGLPPLEAMASGTPVMCSRRASLPEVVGDAAVLIDPESIEDMMTAMRRLVEDAALRKELSAKGLVQAARFSWDRMADQTLRAYEQCLS